MFDNLVLNNMRLSSEYITPARTLLNNLLSAFSVKQFRKLWVSVLFGSMSMSVRMLAQGWLVLEITDSPFWVGSVAGLQGLGLLVFGVFGGTIVDRYDKRKVLILVHCLSSVLAVFTGVLVITGMVEVWHLCLIVIFQGALMGTQLPATNSLAYNLVGPGLLLNSMATRLLAMNISRFIGSLIAGVLLSSFGVGSAYIFAGLSSIIALVILLFITGQFKDVSERENFFYSTQQGLRYILNNRRILGLLLLSLLMEMFGFSHLIMLPIIARDVLGVGAIGLGLLSASSGLGSIISTLFVAGLGDFDKKGMLLACTALCAGLSLVMFAFSPWFAASILLAAIVGGALMSYDVTIGTIIQLLVTDSMRGRVLGVYGLTFGFTPIGGFVAGTNASLMSVQIALGLGGMILSLFIAARFRFISSIQQPENE